jgi:hypothetical protein
MCYYLQLQHGKKKPFALSEDAIAKLFRTTQQCISNYRIIAVEEGFLQKASGHSFTAGQPGKGRAAMFRFVARGSN